MPTCRLATSNAWQGSEEESGLASAKRGAASVPLEGLKGAFPVRTTLRCMRSQVFPMRTLQGWLSRKPSCLHLTPLKA